MAEGTTAIDLALNTEGDADGSDLIEFEEGSYEGSSSGALQYIGQHEEIAARKLAPPFWGKPLVAWLLASFTREIQQLEDTVWEIMEARTLPLADMPRLKVLGKIVGQPRLGFDLERYRTMIEARGLANRSRGRASDLLGILQLILGAGNYILTVPGGAEIYLLALQPIAAADLSMVTAVLPDARAAGVGLSFVSSTALAYDGTEIIWDSSVSPGAGTAVPGVRSL